ncbi:MAG: sugar kinase, partial [Planctomycetota bacterium]
MLNLRPADDCKYDLLGLGEVMLRLTPPGHERVEFASTLEVHVGGGEYNVAYALSRLGLRTGMLTGIVDNQIGQL